MTRKYELPPMKYDEQGRMVSPKFNNSVVNARDTSALINDSYKRHAEQIGQRYTIVPQNKEPK